MVFQPAAAALTLLLYPNLAFGTLGTAVALSEYDRQLAVTLIKLRNGKEATLDGETIQSPPATITEKIAKGVCWEAKLNADTKEGELKALQSTMNAIMAELNGLQSIYRHLDET